MYEYKKVLFNFTPSNLRTKKIEESLDEIFATIEKMQKKDGDLFKRYIHIQ